MRVILCSTSCSTNCFYHTQIYISLSYFMSFRPNCIHQQQNQGPIIPLPGTSSLFVSSKNKFLILAFGFINLVSYLLYLLYYQQNLLKMNIMSLFYLRVGFNLECENLEFFKGGGQPLESSYLPSQYSITNADRIAQYNTSLFDLRVGFNLGCENLEFFKGGGQPLESSYLPSRYSITNADRTIP